MSSPSRDDPSSTKRSSTSELQVFVENLQEHFVIDESRWERLAKQALADAGVPQGEMSISFVDLEAITALNELHMGMSGPTDVLSFPIDGEMYTSTENTDTGEDVPVLLGDVIIAPAVALRNASAHVRGETQTHAGFPGHRGTFEDELALLVVHGTLHLLGHDHCDPEETALMQAAERTVLERYVVQHPEGEQL